MGGIGAEVKILADIAEDEVGAAVAVEVGHSEGFPPARELVEVGGYFGKAIAGKPEEARRHPLAGDDELVLVVVIEVGPGSRCDHADVSDIGVLVGGDIGEMAVPIVEVDKAGGVDAVFAGDASAADEEIGIAVAVEVAGDCDGRVHAIGMGLEGIGVEGEMAFTVAEEKPVLHLAAEGAAGVAARADEQVEISVVVGVEEQNGFVFEVGELVESGFGLFDKLPVRGLEVELSGVINSAADIDIGEAVAVDVAEGGVGALAGKHFGEGCVRKSKSTTSCSWCLSMAALWGVRRGWTAGSAAGAAVMGRADGAAAGRGLDDGVGVGWWRL